MKKFSVFLFVILIILVFTACKNNNFAVSSDNNFENNKTASACENSNADSCDITQDNLYVNWSSLVGYWNAAQGAFAVIDLQDNNTAAFSYGLWETDNMRAQGAVTNLQNMPNQQLTATVVWPEIAENELNSAQPELTLIIIIDYSGLQQDGKIRIKIGENDWKQYMYAGETSEEAYQTYFQNKTLC